MGKEKEILLKTKRLEIRPMQDEEIRALIGAETEPDLKAAYTEMLEGALENPEHRLWYVPWKICLKKQTEQIGDLCFKGPQQKGIVEIGYGMKTGYEGNGYMTEAVRAMTEWAFSQKDVYTIRAEATQENAASRRILEKLSFEEYGTGEEGTLYRKKKPGTAWMPIYMCLGLSCGMSFGISMGNMSIGMCCGMAIGMMVGAAMDSSERKHRAEISEENEEKE